MNERRELPRSIIGLEGLPCLRDECVDLAISTTLRCIRHISDMDDLELAYAEEYAVASMLYYRHDVSMMSDARFDGLCSWLLDRGSYKRLTWLDRESLIAGTGYDTKFPDYLQAIAAQWVEEKRRTA